MSANYTDIAAYQALTQRLQQAAQAAYNTSMAANSGEQTALERAKFAWQQELDRANQTGMWNGQWNNPQEQWFTSQFGQWFGPGGAPTAGQETLSANQQRYNQAYQNSAMFGQYYAPGSAPDAGAQTLEAQKQFQDQQNWLASTYGGYYGAGQTPQAGQQTLAQQNQQFQQGFNVWSEQAKQQQAQQQTAQGYLQLLSQLRGPADYAKYMQVLGSTPGGMADLVNAAMGQYVPGGGATTGMQPTPVSLQSMQQQVAGYGTGGQGGYTQVGAAPTPYGQQPGQAQWDPSQSQAYQASGGGTNMYGAQQQPQQPQQPQNLFGNLPAPNQVAMQSWNNMTPSQQQMLLGGWESQGYDKNDVTALQNQSLPKYAQNTPTAGTWRLNQA